MVSGECCFLFLKCKVVLVKKVKAVYTFIMLDAPDGGKPE